MKLKTFYLILLIFSVTVLYTGCSTIKKEKTPPQKIISKIPPGHARIVGEITKIEPVAENKDSNDPCSKAPCIAMVKVKGAEYGAGFPSLTINSEIKIKFQFTLVPTSKELFPNMEDSYPGLKVGQEFTALVAHIENIDKTLPSYLIYGYSLK
ncbi:MAG: hypothetical protein IH949_01630 [Bacteroidetes bacterium]|nr:hypothetical protein [Bacteroidota bacterium]